MSSPDPSSIPSRCAVVIPALNEEQSVGEVAVAWQKLGFKWVRVVDNGSTDRTAEIARSAGAEVVHEPRRGYGQAAWTGLSLFPDSIEWILFSSADGSDGLKPEELPDWTQAAAEGADFILGDRCQIASSRLCLNPSQRLCSWIFSHVVRKGWGVHFGDVGSLRAIRRTKISQLNLQDRAYGWNVEMQIRAVECGLKITEIPVTFRQRQAGNSKISGTLLGTLAAAIGILKILIDLWWTRSRRIHRVSERAR